MILVVNRAIEERASFEVIRIIPRRLSPFSASLKDFQRRTTLPVLPPVNIQPFQASIRFQHVSNFIPAFIVWTSPFSNQPRVLKVDDKENVQET